MPLLMVCLLPVADALADPSSPATRDESAVVETWGDPEERVQPERGWTWFGMGYESRAGAVNSDPASAASSPSGPGGGQGQGGGKR